MWLLTKHSVDSCAALPKSSSNASHTAKGVKLPSKSNATMSNLPDDVEASEAAAGAICAGRHAIASGTGASGSGATTASGIVDV